jgi:Ras-related protein Rab-6A
MGYCRTGTVPVLNSIIHPGFYRRYCCIRYNKWGSTHHHHTATDAFSDRQSFLSTSKWIEDVRSERGNDVMVVLVGNKADLSDKRQVTLEEATAKAQSLNIMFMETSAKAGHNVKSLFKKIAMSLPGMEKDGQNSDAQNAKINVTSPPANEVPDASACQC